MRKNKQPQANYLDFIPYQNPAINSTIDDKGNVTILKENKGFFYFLTQKLFKKPRVSQIHLDEMGNFIWPLMDGTRTVFDIANLVKQEFGEKAEPLYNRLVTYITTLESYGFIQINKNVENNN